MRGALLDLASTWDLEPELIEVLGAIGPDAKAVLPKLRELRDNRDFETALAARSDSEDRSEEVKSRVRSAAATRGLDASRVL